MSRTTNNRRKKFNRYTGAKRPRQDRRLMDNIWNPYKADLIGLNLDEVIYQKPNGNRIIGQSVIPVRHVIWYPLESK
jgi:hypothetical protein